MTLESHNLLVVDTSTSQPVVGVLSAPGRVHVSSSVAAGGHGRDLIPRVGELLREASLSVMDLRVVAVGLGPGSFTGLRIGLTAARTLAYAAGAQLIGLDSLEGWARTTPSRETRVFVVADAQRGDVYAADFIRDSQSEPLRPLITSRIEPLECWLQRLGREGVVIGPGLESPRIREAVPAEMQQAGDRSEPSRAVALLEMAKDLCAMGRSDDLWCLEPTYLRRSAAEEASEARRGGRAC
jgi:tRNA threonylcarbamoyladenosine biosynthesis protein TsaB